MNPVLLQYKSEIEDIIRKMEETKELFNASNNEILMKMKRDRYLLQELLTDINIRLAETMEIKNN